ncbi:hypothetical protein D9M70_290760 [compost metagenome]
MARGVQFDEEVAGRRHHLQALAGFQAVVGIGGETAAGHTLDRHPQLAVVDAGADGIGAAHFFTVQLGAHHQVLALGEAEGIGEIGGNVEGDGDRVAGFRAHFFDLQAVELAHLGRLRWQATQMHLK